jgi:exo-beta-1,3-glucanase (GH17 family)
VQPFFNSLIEPQDVGALVQRDVQFANFLCSDDFIAKAHRGDSAFEESQRVNTPAHKQAIILEAGWPSAGDSNGHAVPSPENQRIAVDELAAVTDQSSSNRIPVVVYGYEDEPWRDPGLFDIEVSFGIKHLYNN